MTRHCRSAGPGRRARAALARLAPALLPLLLLPGGCASDDPQAAGFEPLPAPPGPSRKSPPDGRKSANPLAFTGPTLDGWTFDFAARNRRRRIVVTLFDPAAPASDLGLRVAQRLHDQRLPLNLEVVGVAVPPGYTPLAARRVPAQRPDAAGLARLARAALEKARAAFPCVLDPDAAIVEKYTLAWGLARLDQLPAFYPFDLAAPDAGRPVFPRFAEQAPDPADYLARRILRRYDVEPPAEVDPLLGDHPPAPPFTLTDTDGKARSLRDYAGRVLVLVLFARDCPRCEELLLFLQRALGQFGPAARPQPPWLELLAVATDLSGDALRALAAQRGYTFPTAADTDWALRTALRYQGTVPDTLIIAPDGTVRYRHRDFSILSPALLHTEIATLLGLPVRPLLERLLFTGDQACRICHPAQHADWALTRHACAWESLVRLGKENDPNCVRCHVVGHGLGGFVSLAKTPHLANVQCESCHGQNGCLAFTRNLPPRVVPPGGVPRAAPPKAPVTAEACLFCHDPTHSPRFDFPAYRARILHHQRAELLKLPRAEREERLRQTCAGANSPLFDPDTPYIGAAACAPCHPTEYHALKDSPHAKALDLLKKPAPDRWDVPPHKRGLTGLTRPECLRCHTTGYGRPGGYPAPATPDTAQRTPNPAALAGVGCEACHGPGKAHAADPRKPRTIHKLAGGCPECSVLPICRQCHDDANDPDFDHRTALPRAKHPVGKAVAP